ncbi:hypothetical protein C2845_PM17G09830 [Panicum miliaceum]|uniref:Uncharacterized protein n=1 Tax=Panicum miliaceum TaxID=4540 RepID=A0A3L6PZJ8_PANMI|nr:hypothetical protein C2845_PM17G09830 [Panicum miliaceum]
MALDGSTTNDTYQRPKVPIPCQGQESIVIGDPTPPSTGINGQENIMVCTHQTPSCSIPGRKCIHDAANTSISEKQCQPRVARRKELTAAQIEAKRAYEKVRYAKMTADQKQARRDRRNARYVSRRKVTIPCQGQEESVKIGEFTPPCRGIHGQENIIACTQTPSCSIPGSKCARDAENTSKSEKQCQSQVSRRKELTAEQIETKCANDKARYANMTPDQKQARRDRQNAQYASRCKVPIPCEGKESVKIGEFTPPSRGIPVQENIVAYTPTPSYSTSGTTSQNKTRNEEVGNRKRDFALE